MNHVVLIVAVGTHEAVHAFENLVVAAIAFNHAAIISGQSFKNN